MSSVSEQDYIEEIESLRKIIVEQSQLIEKQAQKIQVLEEEIARLKNKPKKPQLQPSKIGILEKLSAKKNLKSRKKRRNQAACFLGDVSGHGLGTGYLASSLRSIVRSHLEGGAKLDQTVQTVNRFFMERYQGDEFLTLVAMLINTKTREVEYINAAHPGPYLLKAKKGELRQLKDFQPVIGVLPVSYNSQKIKMDDRDRLFLYSDGVTETFNAHNIPFGEKNLEGFLEEHKGLALQEIIDSLQKQLLVFRENSNPGDDTSIAVLEFSDKPSLFDNIFNFAHRRLLKLIKQ